MSKIRHVQARLLRVRRKYESKVHNGEQTHQFESRSVSGQHRAVDDPDSGLRRSSRRIQVIHPCAEQSDARGFFPRLSRSTAECNTVRRNMAGPASAGARVRVREDQNTHRPEDEGKRPAPSSQARWGCGFPLPSTAFSPGPRRGVPGGFPFLRFSFYSLLPLPLPLPFLILSPLTTWRVNLGCCTKGSRC